MSARFTSVKARAFLQHVGMMSTHSWIFAPLPVNIPDPHFWARRSNSVLKVICMLWPLLSLAGADPHGHGLPNGHVPGLAEVPIPLHGHNRAMKTAAMTYSCLGPAPGGVGLRAVVLATASPAQLVPRALRAVAAAASILLLPTTPVRAGFGWNNVFWRNHPSFSLFQSSPNSDQVSSAK